MPHQARSSDGTATNGILISLPDEHKHAVVCSDSNSHGPYNTVHSHHNYTILQIIDEKSIEGPCFLCKEAEDQKSEMCRAELHHCPRCGRDKVKIHHTYETQPECYLSQVWSEMEDLCSKCKAALKADGKTERSKAEERKAKEEREREKANTRSGYGGVSGGIVFNTGA